METAGQLMKHVQCHVYAGRERERKRERGKMYHYMYLLFVD